MKKNINGFIINYLNENAFRNLYTETFIEQGYKFFTKTSHPYIIDGGSYIGTTIIYFKKVYPNAQILGFEPYPRNFHIIQKNIKANKLTTDVTVVKAALSDRSGNSYLRFSKNGKPWWNMDNTIEKRLTRTKDRRGSIRIKTVKLSSYINKRIDLLKLDIEGAEVKVLTDLSLSQKLNYIDQIIMEFHDFYKGNNFDYLLNLLKRGGFYVCWRRKQNPGLIIIRASKSLRNHILNKLFFTFTLPNKLS